VSTDFPQIAIFRSQLQKPGADFVCTTSVPATSVSLTFLGHFQGSAVLWNMTLATLSHFRTIENGMDSTNEAGEYRHPFMLIGEGKQGVFPIQVGLELEVIDEPVIKKTIIMIRNYKRLAIGRLEFGSMHT
jgi:hypothetical protein